MKEEKNKRGRNRPPKSVRQKLFEEKEQEIERDRDDRRAITETQAIVAANNGDGGGFARALINHNKGVEQEVKDLRAAHHQLELRQDRFEEKMILHMERKREFQ